MIIKLVGDEREIQTEINFLSEHHLIIEQSKPLVINKEGEYSVVLDAILKVNDIMINREFKCNCCNNDFKISNNLLCTVFEVENIGKAKIRYEDLSEDQMLSKTEVESLCDYLKGTLTNGRFIELQDTTLVPENCADLVNGEIKSFKHKLKEKRRK